MSTVCRVARRRFELAGEYFREVRLVAHAAARVRGYRTHPTCDPITTAGARDTMSNKIPQLAASNPKIF